jgi:hypothetical protein
MHPFMLFFQFAKQQMLLGVGSLMAIYLSWEMVACLPAKFMPPSLA